MAASGPAPARRPARTPHRRRQRSVRVTVAVTLLGTATVLVLAALPTRSVLWLSLSSVAAMVLAWAALRMMWTEVLQSRRENAADRAASAKAYRELFSVRAAEHAEFTTAMTERLAEAQLGRRDLEGLLNQAQNRALRAERKLVTESRALVEMRARVHRLEQSLAARQPEDVDALAGWEAEGGAGDPTGDAVTDLVAWQEQHDTAVRESVSRSRPRAASGAPR